MSVARSSDTDGTASWEGYEGRLIFVTQLVDPLDPVLGFVVGWIEALSKHVRELIVIANEVRPHHTASPVRIISLGKEHGWSRARRTARLQSLTKEFLAPGARTAVLAHMCPVYLNLMAPAALRRQVPLLLWYAHPRRSLALAIAERAASVILTSFRGAYPGQTSKLRVIGQGINIQTNETSSAMTSPAHLARGDEPGLSLLALGRTAPIKGLPLILQAVAAVQDEAPSLKPSLRIIGPSTTPSEYAHRDSLVKLIRNLGITELVQLRPAVAPDEVAGCIRQADVLVNATASGSGDKVVLEAMAASRLVVSSNTAFLSLLEGLPLTLQFREGDAADLARRLISIGRTAGAERAAVAAQLAERVRANHSLDHWAGEVADQLREVARPIDAT